MTEAELAPGLELPAAPSLLHEVGFGRDAIESESEYQRRQQEANRIGFASPRVLDALQDACRGKTEEEQLAMVESMHRQESSWEVEGTAVDDPERRTAMVAQDAQVTPQRRTTNRIRSVPVDEGAQRERAREYLSELYCTPDGSMLCQICRNRMPFRINGRDYFVSVRFLPELSTDHHQNRLALCPVCAAKYQHARGTTQHTLLQDLLTVPLRRDDSYVDIPVVLVENEAELRFTAKHALDLQAVLTPATDFQSE